MLSAQCTVNSAQGDIGTRSSNKIANPNKERRGGKRGKENVPRWFVVWEGGGRKEGRIVLSKEGGEGAKIPGRIGIFLRSQPAAERTKLQGRFPSR
jgi:hypothetical protein